jgi:hypothetical protein
MLTTLIGKIGCSRPIWVALRLGESAIATGILCAFAAAVTQGTFSTNAPTPLIAIAQQR